MKAQEIPSLVAYLTFYVTSVASAEMVLIKSGITEI